MKNNIFKKEQNIQELWYTFKRECVCVIRILEERTNGIEKNIRSNNGQECRKINGRRETQI